MNLFTTQLDPGKEPFFKQAAGFTTTNETEDESFFSSLWSAVGANPPHKICGGFTLMEIMVAIAVIAIVSSMVFTQRDAFSRSVGLNNVAHEVALAVRQTQIYGVSSRGSELTDPIYDFSYGIYFDSGTPDEFSIYRDSVGNKGYQPGDVEVETYTLPAGVEIAGVCVNTGFSSTDCAPGDTPGDAVIMFSRPHPNAEFIARTNGKNIIGDTAVILLEEEESGARRKVIVRRSGFITVE